MLSFLSFAYENIFHLPIYNLLIAAAALLPSHDVGIGIVVVTVLIRIATFPLMHRSVVTQRALKTLEPHVSAIRNEYKDNAQEQGARIMALYREHGVNPFSGFFLLIVQLPIIFALYRVVRSITIVPGLLYVFTPQPSSLNTMFLGLVDITHPSILLAITAGALQFFQTKYAMPELAATQNSLAGKDGSKSFADDFTRSLQLQTRYFLPAMIAIIGASLPAAVAIYWVVNSALGLAHEVSVKTKASHLPPLTK